MSMAFQSNFNVMTSKNSKKKKEVHQINQSTYDLLITIVPIK